jgi:hypothetical protein
MMNFHVIASEAKQSRNPDAETGWIASVALAMTNINAYARNNQ